MQPLGALLGCGGGQGDLSGPGAWTLAWPLLRPPPAWLPLCVPRSPLSRAGPETAPLPAKSAAVLPADLAQPASARGASSYPPAWPFTCRAPPGISQCLCPSQTFHVPPPAPWALLGSPSQAGPGRAASWLPLDSGSWAPSTWVGAPGGHRGAGPSAECFTCSAAPKPNNSPGTK